MEDQNKILKEYVEMELENIISEPQVSTRRRNINALIETMNDLPGDFELKNSIGKKLVAIRSFPKPQMNMKLNDLVGELQTKEMAKGGGFYEGWGFNDTFKVLLTGKPANRNEMYRELGQTFPDSDMDKVKADSIEIFVTDNQIKRLRKLARMFQMKLAYSEGGKMATGGNLTPKQEDKFGKVMHEWKSGDLHSGSKKGPIVKDQDQAVAIAFSEARKMSGGGNIEWKNARIGDSARVTSENKMGVIVKDYGRKFHLKFVDGSEKTFDASELDFYRLDEDEFKDGGDVRDYEWYQGFKVIPNAPKPAHYTAIADLGTRKIKRHLDNRMEVDEFLNEMSDREVISVKLSKFTEEGLTRTVKFDWTGDEWNLVSDETVEKKNSKKAE